MGHLKNTRTINVPIYNVSMEDDILNLDTSIGITLVFPNIQDSGCMYADKRWYVNDVSGTASTFPVTLIATGSTEINEGASLQISTNNFGVCVFASNNSKYIVTGSGVNGSVVVESPFTPNNTSIVIGDDFQEVAEKSQGQINNILLNFQSIPIVVNASLTASNNTNYINVASATYTDPTPVEGKGFFVVVRNGTATIGGTAYSVVGSTIYRIYHSGAWANYYNSPYNDATSSIQTQLDNRTTLLAKNNVQVSHTGTLTETLILSYDLTNLFAANDIIKTNFRVYPNNSVNTKTIRIKVNTSATLTGAQTLGTYAFTSSAANFQKALWFENTLASIKAMYPTSSVSNDEITLNNILGLNTITHDFTGPTFFLISGQLTVISDTLYFLNGEILRKR